MMAGDKASFAAETIPVRTSVELARSMPQARWVGLRIWAGGACLTDHIVGQSQSITDAIYVDAGPIADWLLAKLPFFLSESTTRHFGVDGDAFHVHSRWQRASLRRFGHRDTVAAAEAEDDDLRDAWARRHFLRFADTGATLPDIALSATEGGVLISWRRRTTADGRLQFVTESGAAAVSRDEFLQALRPIVAAALPDAAGDSASLQSLQEASELTWEAALSVGTEGERSLLRALKDGTGGKPDRDPAFLASLQVMPADGAQNALTRLQGATRSDCGRFKGLPAHERLGSSPEQEGYAAAMTVREHFELDGLPIPDERLGSLMADIGITYLGELAGNPVNRMVCGRRVGGQAAMALVAGASTRSWMKRMETARGIGRLLMDQPRCGGAMGGASSTVSAGPEHRRSGAFAAQLLLPESGIRRIVGNETDAAADPQVFEELMDKFGVGATTAAYHLSNMGFLSAGMRDHLINAYSGGPGH